MRVRQPEVEGDYGRFHEKAAQDQEKSNDHEGIRARLKRVPDLRHIQRASAAVEQADSAERQESAYSIRNGEIERPLKRTRFLRLVAAERDTGSTHQFEKDEQVEKVAAEAESAHRGEKREHQDLVQGVNCFEIPGREEKGAQHEQSGERRE